MVNTKHDATSYESFSCKREIYNINALYDAFQNLKICSDWKPQVQKFEMNLLPELVILKRELIGRTFRLSPTSNFILKERGKTRLINGDQVRDRVVKRALCDEVLLPAIRKYLIYDNGASLKGKGITFTRDRHDTHLRRFYIETGSNDGYIYLCDYKKFFDNIQHEKLMDMFRAVTNNNCALWLLDLILKKSRVDVSYMNDSDFANRFNVIFNSLEHQAIDKSLLTSNKMLEKHVNIGDQVAQVAGIYYPHRVDNYIKIVEGIRYFGRYMDDTYVIHKEKDYLIGLAQRIEKEALDNGIFINKKKTRILKLSDYWRFLQIQYSLTNTGRIIKKVNPKRLTSMRHKLRKLTKILTKKDFIDYYKAWFRNNYKLMSKQQRESMDNLFNELKGGYCV